MNSKMLLIFKIILCYRIDLHTGHTILRFCPCVHLLHCIYITVCCMDENGPPWGVLNVDSNLYSLVRLIDKSGVWIIFPGRNACHEHHLVTSWLISFPHTVHTGTAPSPMPSHHKSPKVFLPQWCKIWGVNQKCWTGADFGKWLWWNSLIWQCEWAGWRHCGSQWLH
jgi:hypothetical protein